MPKQEPALTIHFQGLCAFVRNKRSYEDTDEITVILPATEYSPSDPPLCPHYAALAFPEFRLESSSEPPFHSAVILPEGFTFTPKTDSDADPDASRYGSMKKNAKLPLGIWPLLGKELRIRGARRRKLEIDPSFWATTDLDRLTGQGLASPAVMGSNPPPLVAARIRLTDGRFSANVIAGLDPDEEWVFVPEDDDPAKAMACTFAQGFRYDYFLSDTVPKLVTIEGRNLDGTQQLQQLKFDRGTSITISNLCPANHEEVKIERDFLSYFDLLRDQPDLKPIPHLRKRGSRINLGACPPGALFGGE